ncbi:hypothetical protein ACFL6O_05015 [candidate division KSB1 bacterium]
MSIIISINGKEIDIDNLDKGINEALFTDYVKNIYNNILPMKCKKHGEFDTKIVVEAKEFTIESITGYEITTCCDEFKKLLTDKL